MGLIAPAFQTTVSLPPVEDALADMKRLAGVKELMFAPRER